ncbi:MAG: prolyl-tRNA synthetase associated domain-containing protein [Clostridia bacterium]|nr:prolyl-tRNA synthetase associated domain-containing protein [Clostridia bacterium]
MKLYTGLENGRPVSAEGRPDKEMRVYALLDSLGIPFRRVDHDAAMTMEDCLAVDGVLGVAMCKNLYLCNRQKTDFYMLLMPGDKPFKTKELSGQLGVSRLSFAEAEFMEAYLDITPGAVSVMGLMNARDNHVRLLIDADLLKMEDIGCHPCVNTASIRLSMEDLTKKFLPAVHHDYTTVALTGEG